MLNFNLKTQTERVAHVTKTANRLRKNQLELYANYILWGLDDDGQKDPIAKNIQTKNGDWSPKKEVSLDDNDFLQLKKPITPKYIKKTKFSREEALKNAPNFLKNTYKNLFKNMDNIELTNTFYELQTSKREKPPREELINRFSAEEIIKIKTKASLLNEETYLKRKHLLIELRREQYTIRDSYAPTLIPDPTYVYTNSEPRLELSVIDFKNPKQLLNLLANLDELKDLANCRKEFDTEENLESFDDGGSELIDEIIKKIYSLIEHTELSPAHQLILDLRLKREKNYNIAHAVNRAFGKSHSANYISTIFVQKIVPALAATARLEEFLEKAEPYQLKKCKKCGSVLPRTAEYFRRNARSVDGLQDTCKSCLHSKKE